MTKVYDQFDRATANILAVAILLDGAAVGRVVIKFGASATAFVHLTGSEMSTARAGGGGYDKASAAVRGAIEKLDETIADTKRAALISGLKAAEKAEGGGADWTTVFARAGFTIANVI